MKKINEGDQFQMGHQIFSYNLNETGAVVLKTHKGIIKSKKPIFTPPKLEEVVKFFELKGFSTELAKTFFDTYENGNPPWTDTNGKQVRSWTQKAVSVWFKKNNKTYVENKSDNTYRF